MKEVAGDIYITKKDINELPQAKKKIAKSALAQIPKGLKFNVIKINRFDNVSLLYYPYIDKNPHPSLYHSYHLTNKGIDFREYKTNKPILHRLETILPKDDPRAKELQKLTQKEIKSGMYDKKHLNKIGRQEYWNDLVIEKEMIESWSL